MRSASRARRRAFSTWSGSQSGSASSSMTATSRIGQWRSCAALTAQSTARSLSAEPSYPTTMGCTRFLMLQRSIGVDPYGRGAGPHTDGRSATSKDSEHQTFALPPVTKVPDHRLDDGVLRPYRRDTRGGSVKVEDMHR